MWEGILTTHELELWLSDMWRWPALTWTRRNPLMANTYTSLSVKGMIYIRSGSPQICVSSQKTAQGRRGQSEDPVYTAWSPNICMGTVVCDVFKSRMHNFGGPPTTLQTEHRTRLQAWFNTYDVSFPTSRRQRGGRRPTHALKLYLV